MHHFCSGFVVFYLFASWISVSQAAVVQQITGYKAQQPFPADTEKSCYQLVQNYTALGDSYSAGLGAEQRFGICPPDDGAGGPNCTSRACARDVGAFGRRFGMQSLIPNFQFLACNGINTMDTLRDQVNVKAFGNPELVTITIGGGDESWFGNIVDRCMVRYDTTACDTDLQRAREVMLLLPDRFDALFNGIRAKINAATTRVIVLGYVRAWALPPVTDCGPLGDSSVSQRQQMNALAVQINRLLLSAALRAKFQYADVDRLFNRHRVCDAEESWLQKSWKIGKDTQGQGYVELSWMHPTSAGQDAYLVALKQALGCQ